MLNKLNTLMLLPWVSIEMKRNSLFWSYKNSANNQ